MPLPRPPTPQVLRAASHPASWAEQPGGMWDAVAASTGME